MDNQKLEIRPSIKFLTKLGQKKKLIIEAVQKVYGDNAPSQTVIYDWIHQLREEKESLKDDPCSSHLSTSWTEENVAAVRAMVDEDW